MSDIVVWNIIGGKKFCSFKKKIVENTFCRNIYNISGLCSRQACPLANSRYATVIEEEGKIYLYMKTPERAHTPSAMWEKIQLHPNFLRALAQINKHLQFWPKFLRRKAKQRLTRIHQYLVRMRRLRSKVDVELVAVHKKTERQEASREKKAHKAAHLQESIKNELLQRLRQGTYGELYDDIINYPQKEFNEVVDDQGEQAAFNWLDEQDNDDLEQNEHFIAAYSDDEEDQEEDEDMEYEYEHEVVKAPKQRIAMRQGGNDDDDDSDDDIDIDDDDDVDLGDFMSGDDDDDDDSDDIEDHVPDYTTIQAKNKHYAPLQNSKQTSINTSKKSNIAQTTTIKAKTSANTISTQKRLPNGRVSSSTKQTNIQSRNGNNKRGRSIDDE